MSNIKVLGIDLAKDVFQLHGTDSKGKKVLSKRLSRKKLVEYMSNLTPCLIGIEACGGSHYWARLFASQGHTVKMMAPQFVKPYVKSNKNDARDAEAIAEAVTRPTMRFVPIKRIDQQVQCEKLGVKIIPKPFVPFIPILSTAKDQITNLIFIDNDDLMRTVWYLAAEGAGLSISTYSSPDE